jgi:N-terminal acetyltransferase B complex non-catalytic subunit
MYFDSCISTTSAFMKKLQADTSNDFIRCPYLATLEIERRKRLHGKGNDDDIVEALMLYFLKYVPRSLLPNLCGTSC